MTIPTIPEMTEKEVLDMAAPLLRGGLAEMDYADIVRTLTVANYVADLCVRVLGDRGEITFYQDMPIVPDALPEHMAVDNTIVQHG